MNELSPASPSLSEPIRNPSHWWRDAIILLALLVLALPLRWSFTHGDLWLDEADYAFAAVRGFQANRWDRSEDPSQPNKILRYRHYHPPLIAHVMGVAMHLGTEDRTLRIPSVLFGTLTVLLTYLSGVLLTRSRLLAAAAAAILALTPADIRAASHALPWSLIIFWVSLLFWTMLKYLDTRRAGWIVACGAALGGLFISSEMFFPVLLAAGICAPILFWPDWNDPIRRKAILIGIIGAAALFLAVALVFWPAGITGSSVLMLKHYMTMSHDVWPVTLRGKNYIKAPKWAYLYWYARFYPAFFLWYTAGSMWLIYRTVARKITRPEAVLLVFGLLLLFTAHRAHIIGPEYLAACLPTLTLAGAVPFAALATPWGSQSTVVRRRLALATAAILCALIVLYPTIPKIMYLDPPVQHSRWPYAARFLAARWQPGDAMLAPAFGVPARWYMLHQPRLTIKEWEVQALPVGGAHPKFLNQVMRGNFRFVAMGSNYGEQFGVDPAIRRFLKPLTPIWTSPEEPGHKSRLIIYEIPRRHPSPVVSPFTAKHTATGQHDRKAP